MPVVRWEQTHFSPGDDIKSLLDSIPSYAKSSIDVEIYGFTDMELVATLISAKQRGVLVRINADRSQAAGASDNLALQKCVDAGLVVKVTESTRGAIDHLKMLIVDPLSDETGSVLKGSYNFSNSAEQQDNFVEWSNDPGKVSQALAKFEDDWVHNKQDPAWQLALSAQHVMR